MRANQGAEKSGSIGKSEGHGGSRNAAGEPAVTVDERRGPIGWFALDRPSAASVPVYAERNADEVYVLSIGPQSKTSQYRDRGVILFHALPADIADPPETTIPLYEFVSKDGKRRRYSTRKTVHITGYQRSEKPVCLVWPSPVEVLFSFDVKK